MSQINSLADLEEMIASQEETASEKIPSQAPIAETVVEGKKPSTREEILSSREVDIKKFKVVKSANPLGTFKELDALFLKPSYDVIALQSGYRSAFKAMNNDNMIAIRKFSGSEREQNLKLFNFVFNQMVNSSLGKVSFDTWLKVTAENDFETLIYGIYCATFPNENDYDVTCPHCATVNKMKISKERLIRACDVEETSQYINGILSKNYPPDELVKHSVVNMTERVMLPGTKIICDIVTPTLADYLRTLHRSEQMKNFEPEIFTYLKYLGDMFIPHIYSFTTDSEPEFIQLETMDDRLRAIVDMPVSDRRALDKAIKEKNSKYKVEYKLPDCNCIKCHGEIKNIVVDMTEQLFLNTVKG